MRLTYSVLLAGAAALGAGALFLSAKAHEKVRASTLVGTINVSGMTGEKARHVLEAWWAGEADHPIVLESDFMSDSGTVTPSELGIGFDIDATLAQVPRGNLLDAFHKLPQMHIAPVLTVDGEKMAELQQEIETHLKDPDKARVFYEAGNFTRQPETGNSEEIGRASCRERV